jgi:hypothetical protein
MSLGLIPAFDSTARPQLHRDERDDCSTDDYCNFEHK